MQEEDRLKKEVEEERAARVRDECVTATYGPPCPPRAALQRATRGGDPGLEGCLATQPLTA